MMPRQYASSKAFRAALEQRLNTLARTEGRDLTRLRRRVAFERLLARFFAGHPDAPVWVLKGGYGLEVRLRDHARSTLDIDLGIPAPVRIAPPGPQQTDLIWERLQHAAALDLDDWFLFTIGAAIHDLEAPPYGGERYPVAASVDGRIFARFHLDVALGDVMLGTADWVAGHDLLGFAGIPPAQMAVLPQAQQFAEKMHAYTLPRAGQGTRVKDLADLALLLELAGLPALAQVAQAVEATFARRATHPLPSAVPRPPESWSAPYAELARTCGLETVTSEMAYARLVAYWARLSLAGPPGETSA